MLSVFVVLVVATVVVVPLTVKLPVTTTLPENVALVSLITSSLLPSHAIVTAPFVPESATVTELFNCEIDVCDSPARPLSTYALIDCCEATDVALSVVRSSSSRNAVPLNVPFNTGDVSVLDAIVIAVVVNESSTYFLLATSPSALGAAVARPVMVFALADIV